MALQRLRMTHDVGADMHLMEGGMIMTGGDSHRATAEWTKEAASIMSRFVDSVYIEQQLIFWGQVQMRIMRLRRTFLSVHVARFVNRKRKSNNFS